MSEVFHQASSAVNNFYTNCLLKTNNLQRCSEKKRAKCMVIKIEECTFALLIIGELFTRRNFYRIQQ
ncbi:hypothetical protein CLV51_101490 [Chitinophaga niastensis]|uniref:Uncharacterized protein n=1 Tax=Chitinophaga niastensis TaxID=536980 RepID=A0A2P8HSE9_CHINA|nr:hypothetical protein CLV51_101490 [Chitinophaga niastensis]